MSKLSENLLTEIKFDRSQHSRTKDSHKNISLITKDGARILNSGKVYRNLFDSEVQLINNLQKIKDRKAEKIKVFVVPKDQKIFSKYKILPPSITTEVALLPENVVTNKNKSDVIQKVVESRKLKFDSVILYHQENIGDINDKTNESVTELSRTLNDEYLDIKKIIEDKIESLESKEMISLTRSQFNELWNDMKHFQCMQIDLISKYYQEVDLLEKQRIKEITRNVSSVAFELERIGHIPPTDVHRLMAHIVCEFNMGILENRQAYSDINTKLMMLCINDDRKRQIYLKNKIDIWKDSTANFYLKDLENRLKAEEAAVYEKLNEYLNKIAPSIDHIKLNLSEFLIEIKDKISPDTVDQTIVSSWNVKLLNIKESIDECTKGFLKDTQSDIEEIHSKYLSESDLLKARLMDQEVFEEINECNMIVDNNILPLIGLLHKSYESNLENIEMVFDQASKDMKVQIFKINIILNSLLILWKAHIESLDKIEDTIFQKLNNSREVHQNNNMNMENELNNLIDDIRQDSNENSLKDNLKKCVNFLDKIKSSYQQFNTQQIGIVKRYPALIETELKKINEKLNENFSLQKLMIKKPNDDEINIEVNVNTSETTKENSKKKKKQTVPVVKPKEEKKLKYEIVEITDDNILNLWKDIESLYETFMKTWEQQIYRNAKKVIATKTEEFNSELKFRYHLHDPRYQRIEYDVHNVRIAELTIHTERVNRQVRQVENLLQAIKDEYLSMDNEQKVRQESFKQEFLTLEDSSLDVSSQAKLQNIRRKLDNRCTQYMKTLRLTLRDFRSNVENRLQNIRKSNAEFVCSFKLFSDGGNFSPEEIDNFSKKIERVNQKVDDVEGEIMSNLEIVEKNQNDVVIQLKGNFEDRFKHHIVDIGFLEKVTRSMAELQIQIKSEVANSNSQSQNIFLKMKELFQMLSTKSKPVDVKSDEDKNYINPHSFQAILALFSSVNDRSIYLDCLRMQKNPTTKQTEFNTSFNNKVKFSSFNKTDVGNKTIKEILKSQNELLQTSEKFKSSNVNAKKSEEIETLNSSSSRRNSIRSDGQLSGNRQQEKAKMINKAQLQDKRSMVFGEPEAELKPTFLNKIKNNCRIVLEGILHAAEIYYRHKGVRKVTQSGLEDTLDQAADSIITRIKGYFQQAEDYRSECLKEFNKQLKEMEKIINLFPNVVFSDLELISKTLLLRELDKCTNIHEDNLSKLEIQKAAHISELRPYLGSPDNSNVLHQLCDKEKQRFLEETNENVEFICNRKSIIYNFGDGFVNDITTVTEELFLLMDNLLTTSDVINAEEKIQIQKVNEIVRQQFSNLTTDKMKLEPPQEKGSWIIKDLNEIIQSNPDNVNKTKDFSLMTSKSTSSHYTILENRTTIVQEYKKFYFDLIDQTEILNQKLTNDRNNYKTYWDKSVDSLTQFK